MSLPARLFTLALLGALGLSSCKSAPRVVPTLSRARVISDYSSYSLQRIGVLPVHGSHLEIDRALELQASVIAEFSRASQAEFIQLFEPDLAEVEGIQAHRRGTWSPNTVLALARRHRLDALLIPTVLDHDYRPPLRIGLQSILVSAETGMSLWQADVYLDAGDAHVRDAADIWAAEQMGDVGERTWQVVLMSPNRLGRFAAYQLARVF